jgi:hypothetical protein
MSVIPVKGMNFCARGDGVFNTKVSVALSYTASVSSAPALLPKPISVTMNMPIDDMSLSSSR